MYVCIMYVRMHVSRTGELQKCKRVNFVKGLAQPQKYTFCMQEDFKPITASKAKCNIFRLNTTNLTQVSIENAFKAFQKYK
jgi:hypothetical protein